MIGRCVSMLVLAFLLLLIVINTCNPKIQVSKISVDGNWSTDQVFSPCDKSCGSGEKKKSRTCTNPAPFNGGKYCRGNAFVVEPCNTFPCQGKSEQRRTLKQII